MGYVVKTYHSYLTNYSVSVFVVFIYDIKRVYYLYIIVIVYKGGIFLIYYVLNRKNKLEPCYMLNYNLPMGCHYDPNPLRPKHGVLLLRLARVNI